MNNKNKKMTKTEKLLVFKAETERFCALPVFANRPDLQEKIKLNALMILLTKDKGDK